MFIYFIVSCLGFFFHSYDETFWKKVDLTNSTLAPGVLGSILHRGAVELKLKKTTVSFLQLAMLLIDMNKSNISLFEIE